MAMMLQKLSETDGAIVVLVRESEQLHAQVMLLLQQ